MQTTKETKIKENNKGITLVALVITVIVLLILATVGIGAIVGEDGLITKAQQAAELYEQASRNEANAINEIFNMVNGGNQGGSEEPTQPVIDATNTNVQFIYTPSTPTKGSVTVEIITTTGYLIQYRKGETGNYSRYTGAFTVEENTVIYAKLANSSGVTGGYITGNVQNIDKVAPNAFTPTIGEITETSIEISASTIDTGSIGCAPINTGIKEYRYYANGELKHTGLEENVTITGLTAETEYNIYVIAEDKAGNATTSSSVTSTTDSYQILATKTGVSVGQYVNYPVSYSNINSEYGTVITGTGWRILNIDTTTGIVKLISEGQPLSFYGMDPTALAEDEYFDYNSSYNSYNSTKGETNLNSVLNTNYATEVKIPTRTEIESVQAISDLSYTGDCYWVVANYKYCNGYMTEDGAYGGYGDWPTTYGVRPVIYLKSNIKTSSGDGTKENPYELVVE